MVKNLMNLKNYCDCDKAEDIYRDEVGYVDASYMHILALDKEQEHRDHVLSMLKEYLKNGCYFERYQKDDECNDLIELFPFRKEEMEIPDFKSYFISCAIVNAMLYEGEEIQKTMDFEIPRSVYEDGTYDYLINGLLTVLQDYDYRFTGDKITDVHEDPMEIKEDSDSVVIRISIELYSDDKKEKIKYDKDKIKMIANMAEELQFASDEDLKIRIDMPSDPDNCLYLLLNLIDYACIFSINPEEVENDIPKYLYVNYSKEGEIYDTIAKDLVKKMVKECLHDVDSSFTSVTSDTVPLFEDDYEDEESREALIEAINEDKEPIEDTAEQMMVVFCLVCPKLLSYLGIKSAFDLYDKGFKTHEKFYKNDHGEYWGFSYVLESE